MILILITIYAYIVNRKKEGIKNKLENIDDTTIEWIDIYIYVTR